LSTNLERQSDMRSRTYRATIDMERENIYLHISIYVNIYACMHIYIHIHPEPELVDELGAPVGHALAHLRGKHRYGERENIYLHIFTYTCIHILVCIYTYLS